MTALPDWLEPLPDAAQTRAVDAWAIEERGIPSLDLMERAGAGLADVVAQRVPDGRIAVVCGKGNNGGDGLVAARVLRTGGREVEVLLTGDPGELSGDPAENLARLPGPAPAPFTADALGGVAGVVDALLGTGFSGVPREPVAGAIEAINEHGAEVVAADVPSGVDASTGAVEGAAVRARATATFHSAKLGLWVAPGKHYAGEVRVIDIGIPEGAPAEADAGLIRPSVRDAVPRRAAGSTKFSEGAVLVAGGSAGLTGAPCLASEAAARAGAGYVTACIPGSLSLIFEVRLLEAMTRSLPDEDGALGAEAIEHVLSAAERADALVLGPGLGRAERTLPVRAPRRGPRPASRCCSTPTASTLTRGAWNRSPAARRRPCSRRTPASWPACSTPTRSQSSARAFITPARPRRRRRRSSSSRATTPWSPTRVAASGSAGAVAPALPPPGRATCSRA